MSSAGRVEAQVVESSRDMATKQDGGAPAPSAVPGFAVLGCLASGVCGLVFAFMHDEVLGIFAAVLAFAAVVFVCFRR